MLDVASVFVSQYCHYYYAANVLDVASVFVSQYCHYYYAANMLDVASVFVHISSDTLVLDLCTTATACSVHSAINWKVMAAAISNIARMSLTS